MGAIPSLRNFVKLKGVFNKCFHLQNSKDMFCFFNRNLNETFHHYFSSLKKTRPFLSWETNLCPSQEKHQNISKTSQNPIQENPSKNIRKKTRKNIKLPAPSIGWCLNRKGLLHGTFCHPFGTPPSGPDTSPKKIPSHPKNLKKYSPFPGTRRSNHIKGLVKKLTLRSEVEVGQLNQSLIIFLRKFPSQTPGKLNIS